MIRTPDKNEKWAFDTDKFGTPEWDQSKEDSLLSNLRKVTSSEDFGKNTVRIVKG